MPVGELTRRMSSAELTEWMAFCLIESDERLQAELDREARAGAAETKQRMRRR